MFSPVHFQGLKPWQVSCYAFFKGWLLLSLPPCCLWFKTPFDALNINLGTLTTVSILLVSEQYLTHRTRFLSYTAYKFWVGKNPVGKNLCKFYPYFTSYASKIRLYWGILQLEPAIARLEWLFTPIRESSNHMHVGLVQASIFLSENFALLTNRSSGFGSNLCD